jgi:hypothetical protein
VTKSFPNTPKHRHWLSQKAKAQAKRTPVSLAPVSIGPDQSQTVSPAFCCGRILRRISSDGLGYDCEGCGVSTWNR